METNITWFASDTFRAAGDHPGIDIGAGDGGNIALVHYDHMTETLETVIDRANLIAAAPEMYEALQVLCNSIETSDSSWRNSSMHNMARAAIAKAQGGAQ